MATTGDALGLPPQAPTLLRAIDQARLLVLDLQAESLRSTELPYRGVLSASKEYNEQLPAYVTAHDSAVTGLLRQAIARRAPNSRPIQATLRELVGLAGSLKWKYCQQENALALVPSSEAVCIMLPATLHRQQHNQPAQPASPAGFRVAQTALNVRRRGVSS